MSIFCRIEAAAQSAHTMSAVLLQWTPHCSWMPRNSFNQQPDEALPDRMAARRQAHQTPAMAANMLIINAANLLPVGGTLGEPDRAACEVGYLLSDADHSQSKKSTACVH